MFVERLQALADEAMAAKTRARRPGALDRDREEHPAPDARPSLEGASRTLDALRQVIHLRAYAQKKPIDEYKQEAFLLFERLLVAIREDVTRMLMRAQIDAAQPMPMLDEPGCPTSSPTISTRSRATTTAPTSTAARGSAFGALPPGAHDPRRRCPTDRPCPSPKAATRPARAARAASTSIATARWRKDRYGR